MDKSNIFDGGYFDPVLGRYTHALIVQDPSIPGPAGIREKVNVLYTEFEVIGADLAAMPTYTLDLICVETSLEIIPSITVDLSAVSHTNFYEALSAGENIYRDEERPVLSETSPGVFEEVGFRFVWVIDYIGEDNVELSVGTPVRIDVDSGLTEPVNFRVRAVRGDGSSIISMSIANTLFSRELTPGNFEITSARHLNNMRHTLAGHDSACAPAIAPCGCGVPVYNYRQTCDINMGRTHNVIREFEPLGVLRGNYRALAVNESGITQYAVINLGISKDCRDGSGCGYCNYCDLNRGLFNENKGTIDGFALIGAEITGQNNGGAVAGINSGTLSRVVVHDSDIEIDGGNVGGIAGVNQPGAVIRDSVFSNSTVSGYVEKIGGITGVNYAACPICPPCVDPCVYCLPGINCECEAGSQCKGILRSGAENSVVLSTYNYSEVGGLVGFNAGSIIDVFFMSINSNAGTPVSAQGGGIAGNNDGVIVRSLYIAPAPRVCSDCDNDGTECNHGVCGDCALNGFDFCILNTCTSEVQNLYPIKRSGHPAKNSFYLSGYHYNTPVINPPPAPPTVVTGRNYNYSNIGRLMHDGLSVSDDSNALVTDFFSKIWFESLTGERFSNWKEGPKSNTDPYPYPILRNLNLPTYFPVTSDRDVIDWHDWGDSDLRGRMELDFKNGDFNEDLLVPTERGLGDSGNPNDTLLAGVRIPFNLSGPTGWHGRGLVGGVDYGTSPAFLASMHGEFYAYYHQDFVYGWSARPAISIPPSTTTALTNALNLRDGTTWRYGVDGVGDGYVWEAFEFQKPISTGNQGRARRGYNGSMTEVYAELNADLESTLYQVCMTENYPAFDQGQQFYYSFHHLTRTPNGGSEANLNTDRMSFFLTGVPAQGSPGSMNPFDGRYHAGYTSLTLIRPCSSPRQRSATAVTDPNNRNSRWYNTAAANTVAYGNSHGGRNFNQSLATYWSGQTAASPYFGNTGASPFAGAAWGSQIYVYDVWVGNAGTGDGVRSGHGITFWSHTNLTVGAAGSNTQIPTAGITQAQFDTGAWTWLTAARNNIFGYWDVSYGWKNYYGMFTVPHGQEYTEFAFQSNTASPQHGNYLAGIEFLSAPAYLTITTDIKRAGSTVNFVIPNDVLTIEHTITNEGLTPAGTIVVENRLAPFHELMNYTGGVSVSGAFGMGGAAIQAPAEANDFTFKITFPPDTVLEPGQSITVSFNTQVRSTLLSEAGEDTWLYFIRNQGRVGFTDRFREYQRSEPRPFCINNHNYRLNPVYPNTPCGPSPGYNGCASCPFPSDWNVSPVVRADISAVPMQMDVVRLVNPTPGNPSNPLSNWTPNAAAPLIDGPFQLTLTISNESGGLASPFETKGVVTDVIPRGFTVSNVRMSFNGGAWEDAAFSRTEIGTGSNSQEQITIQNVVLDSGQNIRFMYILRSTGTPRYGVMFASNARYVYSASGIGRANASFPREVVGISVKTEEISFVANSTFNTLDLLEANGLSGVGTAPMQDDSYNVPLAEVILTDASGNPLTLAIGNVYAVIGTDPTTGVRYRIEKTPTGSSIVIYRDQQNPADLNDPVLFNSGNFTAEIWYRIETTGTKSGAPSFVMNSELRRVTVQYVY
jgi:hypothetical protein